MQCLESGHVSYKRRVENTVQLDVPVEAAVNKEEVERFKVRDLSNFNPHMQCYWCKHFPPIFLGSGCFIRTLHLSQEREAKRRQLKESNAEAFIGQDAGSLVTLGQGEAEEAPVIPKVGAREALCSGTGHARGSAPFWGYKAQ